VLDCGGGIGYGAAMLADRAAVDYVTLVDRSEEALRYAEQHYCRTNAHGVAADLAAAEPFAFIRRGYIYDWATAFEIIEHLPDPRPFLTALPARRLLASVPNEAVVPYSPETAPFHHRHYTREQFGNLLSDCGWEVQTWMGQTGPDSAVIDWAEGMRTLIVEAKRRE